VRFNKNGTDYGILLTATKFSKRLQVSHPNRSETKAFMKLP